MSSSTVTRPHASALAATTTAVLVALCTSCGGTSAPSTPVAGLGTPDAATSTGCTAAALGYPKISLSGATVGFSQSEPETAAFRIAETKSIMDEARAQGATLLHTDANNRTSKQISDIVGMLNRGARLLIVAPLNSQGLEPAFAAARAKKVPVVTIDRLVTSTPCRDYLTFIGSDFVSQGKRAADALIKATGGAGKVAVLLGSSGNGVTTDRTRGFVAELRTAPGLSVVAQQTGNFKRSDGRTVMASLLRIHPEITAVYAENDEMGVGAVSAITAAGKQPGTQIKVLSIDGTHDAVQLLAKARYNGVIESNPRFGPLAFQALTDFEAGKAVSAKIVIQDDEYTPANAAAMLANAF